MKTKLFFIGVAIWSLNSVYGQDCGTPTTLNPTIYPQEKNANYKSGSSSVVCINVFFHIVKNTDGTSAFPTPNTDDIVRELNEFYSPHNIIINNAGTSFINNSNYLNIDTEEGKLIASSKNRSGAINYYIVDHMEYNGFALASPSDALFIKDNRVLTSTSAHELGHCLGVYHTHKGLAYGDSGCAEAIDGSNCSSCGDLICDTPADNGEVNTNGYSPDLTNIMSYFHLYGYKRDHFTNGQGFRMRYAINFESVLQDIKSTSCITISEISTICYPQTSTITLSNLANATTVWSCSSNVKIVSSNNSSATIRGLDSYSNGDGWIKATLSNGITFQENLHIGKAEISNVMFRNAVGGIDYFCSSHNNNEIEIISNIPDTSYDVRIRDLSTFNIVAGPYNFTGNISTLRTNYNYTTGWYLFEVRSANSCGTTNWIEREVEFVDCTIGEGGGQLEYIIYPNPSSETLTIQKKTTTSKKISIKKSVPPNKPSSIELYEFNSNLIYKSKINSQLVIDISDYKKGRYILKITKNKKSETHHIIIK